MRKTACVTGGSGYVASALIKMLLEKGYAVKTTVRNPDDREKNSHLDDLQLQALGRPLEVFRADLDEEGSFDEAVAGCDYAFLVAAPAIPRTDDDPDEKEVVVEAAARGAVNVMRSCVKAGTVRRVVLTSSASAVYSRPLQGDGRHVLQEDSWADVDYLTATKPPYWAYAVSMVLMEKEACRFAQEHSIDLVTVCPVATVGKAPAARKIPASVPACLSLLSGDVAAFFALKRIEVGTGGCVPLVHVDDVCRAEVFVAEEAAAAAGRYICCSINTTVIDIARFLPDQYPQYTVRTELISSSGGDDLLVKPRVCLSSAKLVREGFDFKYNLPDEIYDHLIDYGKAIGILPS